MSEVNRSGWEACESQGRCRSPNMASGSKPNASEELGSLRKMAEAQIRSVRWVRRVARTPCKRRLGSEEARHPMEDEAWVHEVTEGHPEYLKSIR